MEQPSAQRRRSERRRLFDRRSPIPRRASSEREKLRESLAAAARRDAAERRRVAERRRALTRRQAARRRDTPTPFSLQQLETLRQQFARPGPVSCPSCDGDLALGAVRREGGDTMRRVTCVGCGKAAVLTNTYPARVLVIEEKEVVRDALRTLLAGAGHEVVEAADAGVGLTAYREVPPDVVLIDLAAPGRMEAADFIRHLRQEFPDARVIGMAWQSPDRTVDPLPVTTIRMPFTAADVLGTVDEARAQT